MISFILGAFPAVSVLVTLVIQATSITLLHRLVSNQRENVFVTPSEVG
jgi:hypothetical protein